MPKRIYLVGDIVDGERLTQSWHWPQSHSDAVQKLLRKARKGARIVYVPGSRDGFLRPYSGMHFGGIELSRNAMHVTADGVRLLVTHGAEFDIAGRNGGWPSDIGRAVRSLAERFIARRQRPSAPARTHGVVANLIGDFEQALIHEASRCGVDGVVCGHTHRAAVHSDFGIVYANPGDWQESCSAVAERHDGTLEVIRWLDQSAGEIAGNRTMIDESVAA